MTQYYAYCIVTFAIIFFSENTHVWSSTYIWNFMVMAYFVLTVLGFRSYNTACKFIRSLPYILTLLHYLGVSGIWRQSPALPYGSPYLPDKIIFLAFLCLSLRFSPYLAQNLNFSHSQYCLWGIFARI